MSPHKDRGTGTFLIDRRLKGVGRFKIASGTTSKAELRALNDMLTGLVAAGRSDILRAVQAKRYTLLTVLRHWREQSLAELPTGDGLASLKSALEAFRDTHEVARKTRVDMTTAFKHLTEAAGPKATIVDLPLALRRLKDTMRERRTPVAFNRARAYALRFAREQAGRMSPLWIAVNQVDPFTEKERTRLMARKENRRTTLIRRSLTVAEFDKVCLAFRDVLIYGGKRGQKGTGNKTLRRTVRADQLRENAWTLATSGMRPQEFWRRDGADWFDDGRVVRVNGTKTTAARRYTLRVDPVYDPACGEDLFRREFAKATEKALGVALDTYSLRRTFAAWCEEAGIVESRRKAYLGHGKRDVTDTYLQRDVLPFVEQDGRQLAEWIADQRKAAQQGPTLEVVRENA